MNRIEPREWDYCTYAGRTWYVTGLTPAGVARLLAVSQAPAPVRHVRLERLDWIGAPPAPEVP